MSESEFILNTNEGVDTLHRYPAFEECNLDDAEGKQKVDGTTAEALLERGAAMACEHCWPVEVVPDGLGQ